MGLGLRTVDLNSVGAWISTQIYGFAVATSADEVSILMECYVKPLILGVFLNFVSVVHGRVFCAGFGCFSLCCFLNLCVGFGSGCYASFLGLYLCYINKTRFR